MVKTFSPRVSKRKREIIDLSERLSEDLLKKLNENRFFRDAKLEEVALEDIRVREQVRTKFNDDSLKELARNIKENGLIQPLVVHLEGEKLTLICGERRYRAMVSIGMKEAPCFVLKGKTQNELMAIQFSENSSREALHYIDRADGILNYQRATKASERKIVAALGTSKSEVHRSLIIAKMPKRIKEAAKIHDIEKYVLLEFDALVAGPLKKRIEKKLLEGSLQKRSALKKIIRDTLRPTSDPKDKEGMFWRMGKGKGLLHEERDKL